MLSRPHSVMRVVWSPVVQMRKANAILSLVETLVSGSPHTADYSKAVGEDTTLRSPAHHAAPTADDSASRPSPSAIPAPNLAHVVPSQIVKSKTSKSRTTAACTPMPKATSPTATFDHGTPCTSVASSPASSPAFSPAGSPSSVTAPSPPVAPLEKKEAKIDPPLRVKDGTTGAHNSSAFVRQRTGSVRVGGAKSAVVGHPTEAERSKVTSIATASGSTPVQDSSTSAVCSAIDDHADTLTAVASAQQMLEPPTAGSLKSTTGDLGERDDGVLRRTKGSCPKNTATEESFVVGKQAAGGDGERERADLCRAQGVTVERETAEKKAPVMGSLGTCLLLSCGRGTEWVWVGSLFP